MQLLARIIDGAITDDVKLVTLLRQCLILADELNNESLKIWATAELNGYPDHNAMPEYRTTAITAKGLFLGPMGAQINDQPLAAGVLEESHRWWATTAYLKEPVSSYERLTNNPEKDGCATINWPADLTATYQTKYIRGYALNRAWQEIPMGAIAGVVDTVRTRILQLALEVQRETGKTNGETAPAPAKVEQAVQTIIFGGTNIIHSAVGDHAQFGGQRLVVEGDFQSLSEHLLQLGVAPEKVSELEQAIASDVAGGAEKGFGTRVAGWLQNAGAFVGKEGVKAASSTAGKAITTAVLSYFGGSN